MTGCKPLCKPTMGVWDVLGRMSFRGFTKGPTTRVLSLDLQPAIDEKVGPLIRGSRNRKQYRVQVEGAAGAMDRPAKADLPAYINGIYESEHLSSASRFPT